MRRTILMPAALLVALCIGCQAQQDSRPEINQEQFEAYWYQGKAEISSYALDQARYGSQHDGTAVLVFVTEDLSKKKQVKLDHPDGRAADPVKVLKLNHSREFTTGVYEYNVMASLFTPIDVEEHPHSLKETVSVQDWCGQTFAQLNWKGNRYDVTTYSYFESEGDQQVKLKAAWLEDEVWNRIRIAPGTLPTGEIEMIPSLVYARLSHVQSAVQPAEASLTGTDSTYQYSVTYAKIPRTLEIVFERGFPHRIISWTETDKGTQTSGKLINTLVTAYWEQNRPGDESLRERLQLPR